nr:leucine-rich repeat protein [Tanacetum cinerariifolium]
MANNWFLLILLVLSKHFSANIHTCFCALNNSAICSKHERLALLKFKHSVYDAFDMLSSWVGNDRCKWERVHCDKVTGKVDSLHLRGRTYGIYDDDYLIGKEVVTCLKDLRHLKFLDLSGNDFQGSRIPEFIGSFKQPSYLNLSDAFSGIIPPRVGNLSNLVVLDLKTITKPSLMSDDLSWISGLSSLKSLELCRSYNSSTTLAHIKHLDLGYNHFKDLSNNTLSSSVPIMLNLRMLNLSMSNFKQIEDVGIWRQCHLKELRVSSNQFEIKLIDPPKNMSECSKYSFKRLHLDGSLKGAFSADSLGRMVNLRGLRLSSNRLTGPIPESLGRLRLLEELDLSYNQLTSPIPTFIGGLAQLDLSQNLLNGSIPESFGSLTALTYLDLSNNQLTGHVPTSLGRLVSLQLFFVYSNSLEGVITEAHFAKLSMLKYLFTSPNRKLTFNVSREWKPPFQLMYADLSSSKIINEFPQWLRTQKKLRYLWLSNASITGPLPTWLRKMPIFSLLDLSHNKRSGPLTNLPNEGSVDVSKQSALFLQDNLFNESIPISLCRRIDLVYLNLARNRLSGKLSNCLGSMRNLHTMQFSSNQLSGVVPSSILPQSLAWLNLNDNHFTGELPQELGNLRELEILDLGDNGFSGNLPEWIGENLTNLRVFRLHKNNFTGRNQLTGPIPSSIGALNFLSHLNLSHNNLSGQIPTGSQLQTLMDPSIYVGNRDLCGAPLPKNCSNNEDQTTMQKNSKAANHKSNKIWFYVDITCGFAAGFWGVIGVLLFKKHWRNKLFMFAEEIVDEIYVAVVLRFNKMKRGRESA